MARNIKPLIQQNRSARREQLGFIEALDPVIKSSEISNELLNDISSKVTDIEKNTGSLILIGKTLQTLAEVMSGFVTVFNKDISERKKSDFFAGALAKEKEYESKFAKEKPSTKSPTKIGDTKEKSGFFSSLLNWIGGLLVAGGIGAWLWKNENFRNTVVNFMGKMFDGIIEGAQEIYNVAKTWINDEKNQEKVGNFVSGILNAIASGFGLVKDLGNALVKEYEKTDSPFRKTVDGIVDSIWGFVKEHPLLSLGAALVAFSGSIAALAISLMTAASLLGRIAAAIKLGPIGWATLATMLGMEYLADEHKKELVKPLSEEEKTKQTEQLQTLTKLREANPEYHEELMRELKKNMEERENEESRLNEPEIKSIPGQIRNFNESLDKTMGLGLREKIIADMIKKHEQNKTIAKTEEIATQYQPKITGATPTTEPTIAPPVTPSVPNIPTTPQEITQPPVTLISPEIPLKTQPEAIAPTPLQKETLAFTPSVLGSSITKEPPIFPTTPKLMPYEQKQENSLFPTKLNWAPGVNQNIDTNTKNKLMELQKLYGNKMIITSGGEITGHVSGSQHYQGKAVDVRFQGTPEERANFIRKASAIGFTGIGAYSSGLIHLDTRPKKMTWGDTYKSGSEPSWAKTALQEHMKGAIIEEALQTPGPISKKLSTTEPIFNFPLTSPAKSEDQNWFENLINNVYKNFTDQPNLLQKIRATPKEILNAPPKFSGSLLGDQSINLLSSKDKQPDVIINAPNINNGRQATPSKPLENAAVSIFDKEFIELLIDRNVSVNPFIFT